jgi:hypothetical protein
MDAPLVDEYCVLEKFVGKGGWTFARIPDVKATAERQFGMVRVRGSVDDFQLHVCHLMPMGAGCLMLPINAAVRKAIKKQAGDSVHILLFLDSDPLAIPDELLTCLLDDPKAHHFFRSLSQIEQDKYVRHIYAAKTEEATIERLAKAIDRLHAGKKLRD